MQRRHLLVILGGAGTVLLAGCSPSKAPAQTLTAQEKSEFQTALLDGDATIVGRLLSAKPGLVNAPNDAGETPLKVANRMGNQELADVIKRHGGRE
jgi:ankyrin repeat protein